ncbi:serine/threonine-protein kinase Nek6-like [Mizuhopecten yessoensis]|uniref:non-specific serine/threonine protein kinase n=1 Tax=Mizuhopecten yessoensis TaxID=6573 RepID=A0A210R4Q7_MIZYE|nr:serine/threonine-protein kinase Nek6-like [Mizuhopecten yessoensis]XP_021360056.1 serine/threonine-protein kinase Nek6-like [Mizuhopecten yessoensis]OWF55868.1 Serine/threonine-protein kinase Nek4 [Mizuhopecten yessoensis]
MAASLRRRYGPYVEYEQIGQGTFGVVYKVTKEQQSGATSSGQFYALKIVELAVGQESRERELVNREEEILKSAKHHNVVRFVDSFIDGKRVCLIMEYCSEGTLYAYIRKRESKMSEDMFVNFLKQIADGLKYLHRKKVLHRDIKTKNILLTAGHIIKISDFGISRITDFVDPSKHSIRIGTPRYMSPEVLKKEEYGQKTDIWSLGCTAYEMAEMHFAFSSDRERKAVNNIKNHKLPNFDGIKYCSRIIDLMKSMFNIDPDDRPSAKKILKTLSGHECTDLSLPASLTKMGAEPAKKDQTPEDNATTEYYFLQAARKESTSTPYQQPRDNLEAASTEIQKLLVMKLNCPKAVDIVAKVKKNFKEGMAQKDILTKHQGNIASDKMEIIRSLCVALQGTEQALDALKEAKENAESSLTGSTD